MLRRVKLFRSEDVNIKNCDIYETIEEVIKNPRLKQLPLLESELNCIEVQDFCQYFENLNAHLNKWDELKVKISDIHCTLPKCMSQNQFSQAILNIFDLPEIDEAKILVEGMSKYKFLED